jgi:diguanylate cyclase (GGDEF)-like protein
MAATVVKDGLTAHMVNNMMDKREYFLNEISRNEEINALWISRSENVIKQYGTGFINETVRDAIDTEVLKTGKMIKKITETTDKITLRVTIPYNATQNASTVNCLSCHDVQKGDTLGAISMEFDISNMRNSGMLTIVKILGINLMFLIVVLFLINHYVSPYLKLFINLQDGIKKAHSGNFTHRFKTTISGEEKSIVSHMNILFTKMQETIGDIKHNLSTFIPTGSISSTDPLYEAKTIIGELSDIYKFKKTIELDSSKEMVYSRIIDVLKMKYNVQNFAFYEVDNIEKRRTLINTDSTASICLDDVNFNAMLCRAHRTKTDVISSEFINLCQSCEAKDLEYICLPFTINSSSSLILSITFLKGTEINKITANLASIKNYLEAAKPVIESKLLMDKLRDTSLRDGMTGLYNRRFLEEFIDQVMNQAQRDKGTYSVMMLDVDFFKMVNDTYGHDVGDLVIVEIGKVLKENVRNSDLAIRYGGEEFVVMLHNATDQGTQDVAKKIHSAFANLIFEVGDGEVLQKTMSIGISKYPTDADTIWKCIKLADTALYRAKTTGRNKIVTYTAEMSARDDVR